MRPVVFDLDGTLAETWQDLATALNRAYVELGVPTAPAETIRSWIGDGAETMVIQGLPADQRSPERVAHTVEVFRRHYADCCVEETRLYPGMNECLDALADQPLAVASNKPERFVHEILRRLRIAERFVIALGGDSVGVRKPDPKVLEKVAASTRVPARDLWMVGDSPTDVRAARAVGANVIGVTWGYRGRDELRAVGADHLVDDAAQIVSLVRP